MVVFNPIPDSSPQNITEHSGERMWAGWVLDKTSTSGAWLGKGSEHYCRKAINPCRKPLLDDHSRIKALSCHGKVNKSVIPKANVKTHCSWGLGSNIKFYQWESGIKLPCPDYKITPTIKGNWEVHYRDLGTQGLPVSESGPGQQSIPPLQYRLANKVTAFCWGNNKNMRQALSERIMRKSLKWVWNQTRKTLQKSRPLLVY